MMVAGAGQNAQEITITLNPGWNWISYPQAVAMGIGEALGEFVPMEGDIFKSQTNMTSYHNGSWSGGLTQFTPGWGYMYYSARTEDIGFVFAYAAFIFASYKIEKKLSIKTAVFLLLIGSISTTFNQGASVNDMKIVPLYFINALIICLCMITLVIYKEEKYGNNKFVSFYGKNSLLIVCTNNLIIEFLRLLDHLLFNDSLLQIGYLGIFIFFIIITACEYPVLRFFEGKFSRDYFQRKK